MKANGEKGELIVLTKAKKLYAYMIDVIAKAPKRFRFSISADLMNLSLDILKRIYMANDVFISNPDDCEKQFQLRSGYQAEASAELRILGYLSMIASESNCILVKQYEVISRLISDCQNLLIAWMKCDAKRFNENKNENKKEYK